MMNRFVVYQTKDGVSNIIYDAIIPTNMIETHVMLYYTMYKTSDTEYSYYFDIQGTSATETHINTDIATV